NPAPQQVYQSYAQSFGSVGSKLSYFLAVPDGSYTIRLHFVDASSTAANQRTFDINLNGSTAQANFDIFSAAGGQLKAVAKSYSVNASGGGGILLELATKISGEPAILSGIELSQANAAGVA